MWTKTDDGSVVDEDGKVIFLSSERFISDICIGDCCFICGAAPHEKPFNNEHILPEWLLRRYDLFDQTIGLPNGVKVRYGQYTVPCCADCNALLGRTIEQPISELTRGGSDAIREFIVRGEALKLIVWLGLIFLKTHLKDRQLRVHLDARKGDRRIADEYDWADLHHIHCVVRSFYTGSNVSQKAVGSFFALAVRTPAAIGRFDFIDLSMAQTMLLRLDDIGLVTVFNDSSGAGTYFSKALAKCNGPVSDLQLREIAAELAFLNLHIKDRPQFRTYFDLENEKHWIVAVRPQLELVELNRAIRGGLLHQVLQPALPRIQKPGLTQEQILEEVMSGRLSLLFDDNGQFICNSWRPTS